jgi:hypothetical protein
MAMLTFRSVAVRLNRLAWNNVDLDDLCQLCASSRLAAASRLRRGRTLLSFEGLGARARVDLENSIATSIPVFF